MSKLKPEIDHSLMIEGIVPSEFYQISLLFPTQFIMGFLSLIWDTFKLICQLFVVHIILKSWHVWHTLK